MTPYERALEEQIRFLQEELERVRHEQAGPPAPDDPPIAWALRDPGFRQWLLNKQLRAQAPHEVR